MENQVKIIQTHFVMMLDNSWSMCGNRWDDLISQLKVFFKKLEKDDDLLLNSWITIINYNDKAQKMFEQKVPNVDLISNIQQLKGNTNFNEPLIMAQKIISQSKDKYGKIILYFMSDGEADFP